MYIDCSDLIINVYISILKQIPNINQLKDKDLKKLIFHYIVISLLKRKKRNNRRPVYFFNSTFFTEFVDKRYVKCFIMIIKHLKSLLPTPLILVEKEDLFKTDSGELKELNEKISNFYINNKRGTTQLRKYLRNEEFYELIKVLSNIKNIKQLST